MAGLRRGSSGSIVVKPGGMGGGDDAGSRVDRNNLTRPAYRVAEGQFQPTPQTIGPGHPLLDLSTVSGWRLVWVAAAVAYVVGFHVTLGRYRIGLGPR